MNRDKECASKTKYRKQRQHVTQHRMHTTGSMYLFFFLYEIGTHRAGRDLRFHSLPASSFCVWPKGALGEFRHLSKAPQAQPGQDRKPSSQFRLCAHQNFLLQRGCPSPDWYGSVGRHHTVNEKVASSIPGQVSGEGHARG